MIILNMIWTAIVTVIKAVLKLVIGVLHLVLEAAKVFLLLIGLVARLFLAIVRGFAIN